MGRHINADAEVDEHPEVTRGRLRQGTPLEAQAVISPDTHVGADFGVAAGTPDAVPSPAHPDALIHGGLVGDGRELE